MTTANTITAAHVADLIARSTFTDAKLGDKTTVVCMKLPNGYEVVESSGCVDPANYDHAMGVRICKERMVNRVWQLEGYRLQCELATMSATEASYLARVDEQNRALAAEACDKLRALDLLKTPTPAPTINRNWPNRDAVTIETVARIAHEINRAYCVALGDESQLAWNEAPEWQRQSARNGVCFHIGNPTADASASHENWFKEKAAAGWVFGLAKDPEAKTHPCCVPFANLPRSQQAKDHIFRAVVHALVTPTGGAATVSEADKSYREFGTVILHQGGVAPAGAGDDELDAAKAELLEAYIGELLDLGIIRYREHNRDPATGVRRFGFSTETVLWGEPAGVRSDILPHVRWWKAVQS